MLIAHSISTPSFMKRVISAIPLCMVAFGNSMAQPVESTLPSLPSLSEIDSIINALPDLNNVTLPDVNWTSLNKTVHGVKVPPNAIEVVNLLLSSALNQTVNIKTIGDVANLLGQVPPKLYDAVINTLISNANLRPSQAAVVDFLKNALYQDTPLQGYIDAFVVLQQYDLTTLTWDQLAEVLSKVPDTDQNIVTLLNYVGLTNSTKLVETIINDLIAAMKTVGNGVSVPATYQALQLFLNNLPKLTMGEVQAFIKTIPSNLAPALNISAASTIEAVINAFDPQIKMGDFFTLLDSLKAAGGLSKMMVGQLIDIIDQSFPETNALNVTLSNMIKLFLPNLGLDITWDMAKGLLMSWSDQTIGFLINNLVGLINAL